MEYEKFKNNSYHKENYGLPYFSIEILAYPRLHYSIFYFSKNQLKIKDVGDWRQKWLQLKESKK